jgi:asparagine synthase (glutamine-hydrolysing)
VSGICGIVAFDDAPPTAEDIRLLTRALERRGPDGTHVWLHDQVALAHNLLATTPQALTETLPLTHAETGCTITADVRLDNRAELSAALGMEHASRVIGDGELILLAYLAWGRECPRRLLGDFAFAIWDPRTQTLFCARDPMGMRQLIYWHKPGKAFAFASEADALVRLPRVPHTLNQRRVAEYLLDWEGADLVSTFFEGVLRLVPAHWLAIDRSGMTQQRYYEIAPQGELRLKDGREYIEGFSHHFSQAVEARLCAAGPIGAQLSGGMDSGSVAAVAGRLLEQAGRPRLPSFSLVNGEDPDCIESGAIRASQQLKTLDPQSITLAEVTGDANAVLELILNSAEPFDGFMTMHHALYRRASAQGIKVILDGAGGDTLLSDAGYMEQLARSGSFINLWSNARGLGRFFNNRQMPAYLMLQSLWVGLVPERLRLMRRRILDEKTSKDLLPLILHPRLVPQARQSEMTQPAPLVRSSSAFSPAQRRAHGLAHPNLIVGRERYDRVASTHGIEPRDPFLDLRLLEYVLSLPGDLFLRDGWRKWILRDATGGLLPDDVRWRKGKEHLGGQATINVLRQTRSWESIDEQACDVLAEYLSASYFEELQAALGRMPEEVGGIAYPLFLAHWLKSRSFFHSSACPLARQGACAEVGG